MKKLSNSDHIHYLEQDLFKQGWADADHFILSVSKDPESNWHHVCLARESNENDRTSFEVLLDFGSGHYGFPTERREGDGCDFKLVVTEDKCEYTWYNEEEEA